MSNCNVNVGVKREMIFSVKQVCVLLGLEVDDLPTTKTTRGVAW